MQSLKGSFSYHYNVIKFIFLIKRSKPREKLCVLFCVVCVHPVRSIDVCVTMECLRLHEYNQCETFFFVKIEGFTYIF